MPKRYDLVLSSIVEIMSFRLLDPKKSRSQNSGLTLLPLTFFFLAENYWLMLKNILLITLLVVACSGCSMLSLEQRDDSYKSRRETKEKEKTKTEETGTHALLNRKNTLIVEAKGNVTIHPPTTPGTTNEQVLTKDMIEAAQYLKYSKNSDKSSSFEHTAEMEFHRKMSYLGGGLFLAAAIGCLLLVKALGNLRKEATKWGFPVETVGEAAGSMMKMLKDLTRMVDTENASLVNLRTANHLDESTINQVDRQMIKLNEMKRVLDRAENIKRSHSSAMY